MLTNDWTIRTVRTKKHIAPLLLDEQHEELFDSHNWHPNKKDDGRTYFATYIDGRKVYLHRLLTNAPEGKHVDHINGNTLDNRSCNLRVCTPSENLCNQKRSRNNKSGYKGVSFHKESGKYTAKICKAYKVHHLGYHATPQEAHAAYVAASKILHGEFSRIK